MATSVSRATNNKIGTCPHGLPMGACPICNGMGGGGSVKRDNKPREMTWNECYAIGQMLKAQKLARENSLQVGSIIQEKEDGNTDQGVAAETGRMSKAQDTC